MNARPGSTPETATARADARFYAALACISDAFYATDAQWRIVIFNPAAERYFGFGPERVIGRTLWDIFPQGRGTPFGDALEHAMQSREASSMHTESSMTPGRSIDVSIGPWDEGVCVAIHDRTERDSAQQMLRDSEERLRLATEGAGLGAYEIDLSTGDGVWSPSAFALLGLEPTPDLRGTSRMWSGAIHPDDLERVSALHNEAAERGGAWQALYRVVSGEGLVRWIETHGQFIKQPNGGVRSIGIAADITDRKLAEERLERSEERFRTLYNSIEAGFYIAEYGERNGKPDYRYLEANPALERLTGLKDIRGRWRRDIDGAPEEFWFELFERVVRTQTAERVEHGHQGLGRWYDVYVYPLGDPAEQRFAVISSDITERKRAEIEREEREAAFRGELERAVYERTRELQESEARLRAIFETSHMYQALLTPDGTLVYSNATSLSGINATLLDVKGAPFWETPWFSKTDGAPALIRDAVAAVSQGETVVSALSLHLPVGRRHFEFAMRPMRNERGEVIHLVPEAIDVTARVEAESALRQAQKLEAMGQLTGGVAHDFNNLLMVISGGLNMLERKDEPGRREMLIGRMRDAVDRGAKLTQQLLAFSRKHDLTPTTVDFALHMEAMRELLDRSLGGHVRVALDAEPNLKPVFADQAGLQQAILNLAVNARDAMPEGGVITIRARNGAPADARAPYVSIAVVDAGVGMSADVMARVFEPFFTTKDVGKGSGLGLAQVHGFVQQSGGRIEITSAPGAGTTMTLVLPRSTEDVAPAVATPPTASVRTPKRAGDALLVEDDDDVAPLIQAMLEDLGWRVTRAASGEAALDVLTRARFDLVVSDVMMPGGMNGLELSRRVRASHSGLPVLLASGYAAPVAQDAAKEGVPLLPKPFSLEALSIAIESAVAAPR